MKTNSISLLTRALAVIAALIIHCNLFANEPIGGIGAWLEYVTNQPPTIIKVFPDSPAERAGLVPGQILQKVDGISVVDKNGLECAKMIQGAVGTPVRLEVIDPVKNKTNTVTLTREALK